MLSQMAMTFLPVNNAPSRTPPGEWPLVSRCRDCWHNRWCQEVGGDWNSDRGSRRQGLPGLRALPEQVRAESALSDDSPVVSVFLFWKWEGQDGPHGIVGGILNQFRNWSSPHSIWHAICMLSASALISAIVAAVTYYACYYYYSPEFTCLLDYCRPIWIISFAMYVGRGGQKD